MTMIVPLDPANTPQAARLIVALRTELNGHEVCTAAEVQSVLLHALKKPTYCGLVALATSGTAIGYLGMNDRFAVYAGGPFAQITELYVAPEVRRKGVAEDLVTYAEGRARVKAARSMEVGAPTAKTHPEAHAFYQAVGYVEVGPRLSKAL
jgi:GNAT superfamily N-acetyltransferase